MTALPAERLPFDELPTRTCPRCERHRGIDRFCPGCERFLQAPDVGRLARPRRRLGAAILDSLFQGGGIAGAVIPGTLGASVLGFGLVGVISTAYWGYTCYLWTKGTTPAKKVLDLSVIGADGDPVGFFRMAFRETIGKPLSMAIAGLGIVRILWDKERQGWHDKIFDTWVVQEED